MPGTYTNIDPSQGSISVNIRGMQGFGRVNTMVDGVKQTFFGSSTDSSYHDESGTSAFGSTIDQNFLIGVDISRGFTHGSSGANALTGSANFRTIGVNDLLLEGKNSGFMGKFYLGNQGLGPNAMIGIAGRKSVHSNGSLGFLMAVSGKKIEQNYRTGDGHIRGEPLTILGEEIQDLNPKLLKQEPRSFLFKAEYLLNPYNSLILSYRGYENAVGGRNMDSINYQLDYTFNPQWQWINAKLLFAYNQSRQNYLKTETMFAGSFPQIGLDTYNDSYNLDISNTSSFDFFHINSDISLGVNFLLNDYRKYINFPKLVENSGSGSVGDIGAQQQWENNPFSPAGKQLLTSIYFDTSWRYKFLEFQASLNASQSHITGHKPACEKGKFCFPRTAVDIKKNHWNFNPSIMLSADFFHNLLQPFVSYSRSSRAPNPQEIFFSNEGGDSMNPFLKPETNNTFQAGINSFKQGIFTNYDTFGFKALYYHSNITNFIYSKSFIISDGNALISINSSEAVKMQGLEAELTYDIRYFYTKLSYSLQNTDQPVSELYGPGLPSFGFSRISVLPKGYGTFIFGTKLWKDRIDLGFLLKYTGQAKRVSAHDELMDTKEWERDYDNGSASILAEDKLPDIPTIADLYLKIQIGKNIVLRGEIKNLFDKNYIDALQAFNSTGSQQITDENDNYMYLFTNAARGRTYMVGIEVKF